MATLTIRQAAKEGWSSRADLYRKAKSGELSTTKDSNGVTFVDSSELVRVYGSPDRKPLPAPKKAAEEAAEAPEVMAMRERLARLEASNARLEADLEALKDDKSRLLRDVSERREREDWLKEQVDAARKQLDEQIKLLTDQTEKAKAEPPKGLLARIFGGRAA